MKTIWKYPLDLVDTQLISMPEGAKILCAQIQRVGEGVGRITLWAVVEPMAPPFCRTIRILGTGGMMPGVAGSVYIGTVQDAEDFVWHVFDEGERPW